MNNFSPEINRLIDTINSQLCQGNTSIFCGAGISFNSGLPLANDLVKRILEALDVNGSESSLITNSNLPFESFIQTLMDEVSIDQILDIFCQGVPNTNHDLIAQLIKGGFIRTVLTTNFDQLIEKALTNIGLIAGIHYDVFSTEKEFGKIDWVANKVRIIKIHGCVSNKLEMSITLNEVAKKTISRNKANIINIFFTKSVNQSVLVLGYSCSDLFDICPQIESIDDNKSEVIFVDHLFDSNFSVEDVSLKHSKNPFRSFTGKRISLNTNTFVEALWSITSSKYHFKVNSICWQDNVDQWLNQSIKYSIGIKNHIAGRLFYDIGEFEISIRNWETGIAIAQSEQNQVFFYSQLGNLGMAYNALSKYKLAKTCLQESVNSCLAIGNVQGVIAQSQTLGNVYRNLAEFEASIKSYNQAIAFAEQNDLDGLCSSLGNLATVYNQINEPDQAIKALQKGIAIALATGKKQSEGSMLCSLGVAYFKKGEYEKALRFIKDSVNTTRLIGDKQGECMALINLSNLSLSSGEFDNSINYATLALKIAKKIGIQQSEAGASYNIGSSFLFKKDIASAIPYFKKSVEIYSEIYGTEHPHTISAMNALNHAYQL